MDLFHLGIGFIPIPVIPASFFIHSACTCTEFFRRIQTYSYAHTLTVKKERKSTYPPRLSQFRGSNPTLELGSCDRFHHRTVRLGHHRQKSFGSPRNVDRNRKDSFQCLNLKGVIYFAFESCWMYLALYRGDSEGHRPPERVPLVGNYLLLVYSLLSNLLANWLRWIDSKMLKFINGKVFYSFMRKPNDKQLGPRSWK